MEPSSSAAIGSLRVGLQIVTNHKRPLLEVYHDLRNQFGPVEEYESHGIAREVEGRVFKHRRHEFFVQFTLINIGGIRAENVELKISGDLVEKLPDRNFGERFETVIPQLASGQSHFLLILEQHELLAELNNLSFTLTVSYDAPKGFVNWLFAPRSIFLMRKPYALKYVFSPKIVSGRLPPAEYLA